MMWCLKRVQHPKSSWAFNSTHFILLFGAYNHTPPKSSKSYYKWGGQIETDHLIPPTQSYSQTKNNSMQPKKIKKCYKSWQRWKLLQLHCHTFTDMHRHIRTAHIISVEVGGVCRFPQPWSNSTHGSLLQWGCDVPAFNIPWLYNGTWVTSHGAPCSSSPSVYLVSSQTLIAGEIVLHLMPARHEPV